METLQNFLMRHSLSLRLQDILDEIARHILGFLEARKLFKILS